MSLATASGAVRAQSTSPSLPEGFERYLAAKIRPTAAERKTLLSGGPLTKLLPADESKEVFVFGIIWIDASPTEYVRRVKNIEEFEKGAGSASQRRSATRRGSRILRSSSCPRPT